LKGIFFGMLFEIFFVSLLIKIEMMAKNYFYTLIALVFFCSFSAVAQETKQAPRVQETSIEGLSLYPNPVSNGKVFITTKNDLDKEIIIFDVLGKKVLHTMMNSKELNVSALSSGVYIIRINEKESSATRKLIIK
jgi:hypothetical protein